MKTKAKKFTCKFFSKVVLVILNIVTIFVGFFFFVYMNDNSKYYPLTVCISLMISVILFFSSYNYLKKIVGIIDGFLSLPPLLYGLYMMISDKGNSFVSLTIIISIVLLSFGSVILFTGILLINDSKDADSGNKNLIDFDRLMNQKITVHDD